MTAFSRRPSLRAAFDIGLLGAAIFVIALIIWQGFTARGTPDPTQPGTSSTVAFMDIGVLVFREGLECILVLSDYRELDRKRSGASASRRDRGRHGVCRDISHMVHR